MKILALETSGVAADVALLDASSGQPQSVASRALLGRPRTAQTLAPAIRELLTEAGWKPGDVELVAVATGPGSFTGLRLGVTTAKVFAYAAAAKVQGVNTLQAIAMNAIKVVDANTESRRLRVVMDAQRNQVFAATFSVDQLPQDVATISSSETSIVDDDAWWRSLAAGDLLLGPGLNKFRERLADVTPSGVQLAPEALWQPTATTVGQLACEAIQRGNATDDVWSLSPQYFRQSAAEEKRQQGG